ncbi:MAG: hypothetical protein CW338_05770 [Clostridiales bacterium]|nr:hypothetical protein [Clostridiales bacterium]
MKRSLAVLICAVILTGLLPVLAAAETITPVMYVTNCSEWVSLREKPDSSSKRLLKVHLGELVTECTDGGNGFVRCEFGGKTGYIQSKYLKKTNLTGSEGILNNQMVIKVDEWVSLREQPDTSSKRLAKVPLGSVVTQCVSWNGNFVYCCYKGQYGYIATQYLTDADWNWLDQKEQTYPPVAETMEVVNCSDWVSLRQLPSTKSPRLEKVPLGAIVTGCEQVTENFISCSYNGKKGYIQLNYLAGYYGPAEEEPVTDEPAEGMDSFSGFSGAIATWGELVLTGDPVLFEPVGVYTVIAQRIRTAEEEMLYAACYDEHMQPMWCVTANSYQVTELTATDAFIAGTAEEPVLVIFTAGEGLTAYAVGPVQDELCELWTSDYPEVAAISGCICHALDEDGTIYVCGYYDAAPTCISRWGIYIWTADNENTDIYFPYQINVSENGIAVLYDSYMEDSSHCYVLNYDRGGTLIYSGVTEKPGYESEFLPGEDG